MKTAISLPDDLFDAVEAAAKRMGMTRSQFYQHALRSFLDLNTARDVTARLNAVYSHEPSTIDPLMDKMQAASLPKEDW